MAAEEIEPVIRAYLASSARHAANGAERLSVDFPLLTTGILDSLNLLGLIVHLETVFSIAMGDDDLVPENFESIRSIAVFVASKR